MLVQGINLPEDLLRAQAVGKLVIFVGAGVSAPAPSSLPLFDDLAAQVGEGTALERGPDESVDHYFGRLKLAGVQVHKAVARILLNPNSQPHELHTIITKLFPDGAPVRIVTTNFDSHLSTALQQQFGYLYRHSTLQRYRSAMISLALFTCMEQRLRAQTIVSLPMKTSVVLI
jgi:NAD-dependent SIR2 family protein deacetylase